VNAECLRVPSIIVTFFSNHYLAKLLQANPEWKDETGLAEAYTWIKELKEMAENSLKIYI
jgi:hypothetical protein